jgi:hypothetical protein
MLVEDEGNAELMKDPKIKNVLLKMLVEMTINVPEALLINKNQK